MESSESVEGNDHIADYDDGCCLIQGFAVRSPSSNDGRLPNTDGETRIGAAGERRLAATFDCLPVAAFFGFARVCAAFAPAIVLSARHSATRLWPEQIWCVAWFLL